MSGRVRESESFLATPGLETMENNPKLGEEKNCWTAKGSCIMFRIVAVQSRIRKVSLVHVGFAAWYHFGIARTDWTFGLVTWPGSEPDHNGKSYCI
jgi:hypothetical protein